MPIVLGAIIIVLRSIYMISMQVKDGTFNSINIVFGILIASSIYGLIVLSYLKENESWALSPVFRFPIFMIYLPFLIAFIIRKIPEINLNQVSDPLLISIVISGIFMIIFNSYFFNIIEILGKTKHF